MPDPLDFQYHAGMTDAKIIKALTRLRGQLSGEILDLHDRQKAIKADMAHVDAVLALLGWEGKPCSIRPIRKGRDAPFGHKQFPRFVYDAIREGAEGDEAIVRHIMETMGWDMGDVERREEVARRVGNVTKNLSSQENKKGFDKT